MTKWLNRSAVQSPYMALCLDKKAYKRATKGTGLLAKWPKWLLSENDATTYSAFGDSKPPLCIVCMEPNTHRPIEEICGLLAHEAVHVYETMKSQNNGMPWENEELAAVSIAHITQMLMRDWIRQTGQAEKLTKKRKTPKKKETSK